MLSKLSLSIYSGLPSNNHTTYLVFRVQVTFNGKIGEEGFENKTAGGDPDEEQIFLEEQWPHIQVIYELLLRIIIQPQIDVRYLKAYITQEFISKVCYLLLITIVNWAI